MMYGMTTPVFNIDVHYFFNSSGRKHTSPACHVLFLSQLIYLFVSVAAAILEKVGKPNIKLQMVGVF